MSIRVLLIGDLGYVHVRKWARSLAERDFELFVLTDELREIDGVPAISGRVDNWRPWRPKRWVGRRRDVVSRAIHRLVKPDIVHVHFPDENSVFPEDLNGIPLVVSPWGADIIRQYPETASAKEKKVRMLRHASSLCQTFSPCTFENTPACLRKRLRGATGVSTSCPSSNKWDRCAVRLSECFAHHFHVMRRVVDSANDVPRWSFV